MAEFCLEGIDYLRYFTIEFKDNLLKILAITLILLTGAVYMGRSAMGTSPGKKRVEGYKQEKNFDAKK